MPEGDSAEFGEELFPEAHHICMVFDDEEQCSKVVVELLTGGLRRGELIRYLTDVTSPEEVRSWLVQTGIDLPEGESFNVFTAESFYYPGGRFDPHEMISGMISRYEQFRAAGYPGIRSCGEMTWALGGIPGSDGLLEYEALMNTVTSDFPHAGICLYDARRFGGATLFRVLAVHPYLIAQGQIVRNPPPNSRRPTSNSRRPTPNSRPLPTRSRTTCAPLCATSTASLTCSDKGRPVASTSGAGTTWALFLNRPDAWVN